VQLRPLGPRTCLAGLLQRCGCAFLAGLAAPVPRRPAICLERGHTCLRSWTLTARGWRSTWSALPGWTLRGTRRHSGAAAGCSGRGLAGAPSRPPPAYVAQLWGACPSAPARLLINGRVGAVGTGCRARRSRRPPTKHPAPPPVPQAAAGSRPQHERPQQQRLNPLVQELPEGLRRRALQQQRPLLRQLLGAAHGWPGGASRGRPARGLDARVLVPLLPL
jgi:hypothetical protein